MKRNYAAPPIFPPPPDPWPVTGAGSLAVAVPTVEATLSADSALSLESLRRRASGVDRYLVIPQSLRLDWKHDDFRVLRVPDAAMADIAAYNRLMLTPWFYRLFAGYEALLIFQTDCLLLRDDLADWAARGWSYVGAPWFARKSGNRLKAVGNGGLSLRRPADAAAVLQSDCFHPRPRLAQQFRHFASFKHLGLLLKTLAAARQDSASEPPAAEALGSRFVRHFARPEDEFWGQYAPFFHPGFRVPDPAAALDFAFEPRPADCLKLNGGRTPLGCHAWAKMDRGFWLEFLAARDPSLLEILQAQQPGV
jgi:hypothetical protein